MDNGIEIPVNDMSVQENSQKLANDLNLALDMGYERVAADSGLYTGYDSGNNTWELIVKYVVQNSEKEPVLFPAGERMAA